MGKSKKEKKAKKVEKKPKKVSSSESSSEEETVTKQAAKEESSSSSEEKSKPAAAAMESSSDDSSSEEESKPAAKGAKQSSSSSGDSSSEEDEKDAPAAAAAEEGSSKKRKADDSESAPKKTKSESAGEGLSIWVGNLSYDATDDDLREFFSDCGEINGARVISRDGRSKGFGYVDFATEDARAKALDKNEADFMGRNLMIKPAESKPDRPEGGFGRGRGRGAGAGDSGEAKEPSASLFVGNLSWDATEDTLREAFGAHGEVTSVRIATDKMSGKPRGFAHVEYADVDAAKAAKEALDGTEILGRGIRLDFASQKQGFGGRGGDRGGFGGDRGGRGGRGRGGFGGRGGRGGRGRGGSGRGGRGGFDRGDKPSFQGKRTTFDE